MKKQAKIYHFDSFGKRQEKYDRLNTTEFQDVSWKELELKEPYYFFVPKDFGLEEKYNRGCSVSEIFQEFNSWIESWKDKELVKFNSKEFSGDLQNYESTYLYRPFDIRFIPFDNSILHRSRLPVMGNMLHKNLGLISKRWIPFNCPPIFLSNTIVDRRVFTPAWTQWAESIFPLYLYQQNPLEWTEEKTPNFNMEVIQKIEKKLKMKLFIDPRVKHEDDNEKIENSFSPEDLLDYIYAVLHSKSYRDTYKEFLKIDFPKIPFDVSKEVFLKMRDLWRELREYHLMENEHLSPQNFITTYPVDGDNEVGKVRYEIDSESSSEWQFGKVFINDGQYFEWVPNDVWEFYIWWYQPAQKWLKDRKGRKLTYEDILHYSKIVVCLKETMRIMEEIEHMVHW